ncbi:MAG TPA: hypothetical protein VL654_07830 [Casimicrobiaceae bacterium]|nr:hypothetical protein [Casimicrobiaceae bacterium]
MLNVATINLSRLMISSNRDVADCAFAVPAINAETPNAASKTTAAVRTCPSQDAFMLVSSFLRESSYTSEIWKNFSCFFIVDLMLGARQ